MTFSEALSPVIDQRGWENIRDLLKTSSGDAQLVFWAPEEDVETALIVLQERCQLAFEGVPNETRKSMPDGTTIFERVLPGPDRMYPDTDSAPIPITNEEIEEIRSGLAIDVSERAGQLHRWKVPATLHPFLLRYNLVPVIERITATGAFEPRFVACLLGHGLKNIAGICADRTSPDYGKLPDLFADVARRGLVSEIMKDLLPLWYRYPHESLDNHLKQLGYRKATKSDLAAGIGALRNEFSPRRPNRQPDAEIDWIVGKLRPLALGNVPLAEVRRMVSEEVSRG